MNKEKYTSLEIGILVFFLLNSFTSTITIQLFKNTNTISVILTILLAFILGLIFIKIIVKLFSDNYLKNLSNIKILNNIIKILLLIGSLGISIYVLLNLSLIIKNVLLTNMSIQVIQLTFLILSTLLAIKGIKSITIAANIMFIVYFIFLIINFSFNLSNINTINLLPINTNIENINFFKIFLLTVAPVFMILIIPKNEIIDFNDCKRKTYIFFILFYIYLLTKILFIISVLGDKYYSIIAYPEIEVLKIINIFNFFERLEEILIINIFIENLIVLSMALNYSKEIIKSIYNIDNKIYYLIDIIIFFFVIKFDTIINFYFYIILTIFIFINILAYKKNKS